MSTETIKHFLLRLEKERNEMNITEKHILLKLGLRQIPTEGLRHIRLCLLGSDVPILLDGDIEDEYSNL